MPRVVLSSGPFLAVGVGGMIFRDGVEAVSIYLVFTDNELVGRKHSVADSESAQILSSYRRSWTEGRRVLPSGVSTVTAAGAHARREVLVQQRKTRAQADVHVMHVPPENHLYLIATL